MSFDRHGQRQPGAASAASVTDAPSPGKRTLVQDLPATAPVQRATAPRAEPRVPAPGIGGASPRSWPDTIQQLFGPTSAGQVQRAPSTGLAQARSSFAAAFEPGGDATHAGAITEQARAGVAGSGQQVPHLAAIQRSFGSHDISGVRAHVGGKTADAADAMGAEAYAHGNDVAFRQSPDLHTAAHEAAHVVQQQAGIQLKGGLGQSGDGHERHADAVADRVVRGESAQSLLDQYASGGATTGGGAAGVQYLFQTMTTALEAASHDRGGSARSNPEYVAIVQLLNQGIQLQQVTPPTVEVVSQMLGVIAQIQTKVTAARSTKWFSTGTDRNNALQALTTSLTTEQTQLQAQQTQLRTTAAAAVNAAGPHPGLGQGPHQMANTGAQQGASGSYFDRAPGTNALNGVFKPESQEAGARTGRGKRGEGAVREVMGDTLDHHLGLGVVPPTRLSAIDSPAHPAGATQAIPGSGDSLQVGSYQQAVANPTGDLTSYMEQRNATQAFDPDSLQKIAILDMISLNKDRHGANVMHDAAGGLHAIDQGEMAPTAMGYNGRFRDNNNASGWAWADLPESEHGWSAANRQTIATMDPDATVDLLAQQARTTSAQVASVTGQPAADTHLSESQIAMMKYGARTLKLCAGAGLTPSQTETIYTKRASDRDARQIGGAVQRTAKTAGGGEFADFINKTFFQDDLAAQTAQMTHTAPPAPVFAYQAPACEEEWSIAMAKGLNRVAVANPAQLPAIHQALDSLLLPVQAGAAQQPVTPNDTAATASRLWAHIETGKTAVGTAGLDEKEVLGHIWTSGTPQRRQRIIQVLDVQGDQLRMSHLGYILEAVDPQHRMNLPSQLVIWYQDHTARGGDFIDWLVAHAPAAGDTTDYRDAQRRADVEVHVNGGQLAQVPAPGAAQAPMTTSGGDGWAVVLSAGQFYSQPKSPASAQVKTQHSSFMDGLPVDAAAMMRVNGGTLQFLRNHSGHYTPTTANMVRMILTFLSRGVAMADVTVRDDRLEVLRQNRAATPKTEFDAMEYLGIARDQTR